MTLDVQPMPLVPQDGARSSRLPRFLASLLLAVAIGFPIGGIAYLVNGATQAHGPVKVTVRTRALDRLTVLLDGEKRGIALRQSDRAPDAAADVRIRIPGAGGGNWLVADAGTLTLSSWGSTVPEQLAARGGAAVTACCVGAGAWLTRRVMASIAAGRPFDRRNPRRIAGVAGVIVLASLAAPPLTALAAGLVLDRLGLDTANAPVAPPYPLPQEAFVPCLVALVVLVLAGAFRRGGELSDDVEGLV